MSRFKDSQTPLTKRKSLASDFCKGVKRDIALFQVLKNESNFDTWRRTLKTQARAQNVFEPLDLDYIPTDDEEMELFDEKQKFITAVFDKVLKTSMGQAIFRKYQSTSDAYKMYKELLDHSLKSTGANIDASQVLAYLTSAKLGD